MLTKLHRLNQVGDTMVEVLISMAIVSMILGGAYVTSNKSLLSVRDAQEHVDALKLASSQIESLNAIPAVAYNSSPFCYGPNGTLQAVNISTGNCTFTGNGALATNGVQPAYSVAITYDPSTLVYKVKVNWDTLTSQAKGTGNVEMYYRTNQ